MSAVGVFGISGVGKTSIIEEFVKNSQNWIHLQASQLISHDFKTDFLNTQNTLVENFKKAASATPDKNIFLDGHSIIDTGSDLLPVPCDIVQALGLSALVFIFDTPLAIYGRRKHDRSKPRQISDIKTIEHHQAMALHQVYNYRDSLSLPVYQIKSGDHRTFAKNFT